MNPLTILQVAEFLDDIQTDLVGAFIGIFTDQMGVGLAWGIGILILMLPLYNRVGAIPTAVIGAFLMLVVGSALASQALQIGYILIAIPIAILIGTLILSWRRTSG